MVACSTFDDTSPHKKPIFADDAAALVAHKEGALQQSTSCCADAAQLLGLQLA